MLKATPGGAVAGGSPRRAASTKHWPRHAVRSWTSLVLILTSCLAVASCSRDASTILGIEATDAQTLIDADLIIMQGASQQGEVASLLPKPVVVQVVDASGRPLIHAPLEWVFLQGAGRSEGETGEPQAVFETTTNGSGRAVVWWQLGTAAGVQEASVSIVIPSSPAATSEGPSPAPGNGNGNGKGKKVGFFAHAQPAPASNVAITPQDTSVAVGDQLQLSAVVTDAYGNTVQGSSVTWSSMDQEIALVDQSGMVSGVNAGADSITAESDGVQTSVPLTVTAASTSTQEVAQVVASPDTLRFSALGQTSQISVVAENAVGDPLSGITFDFTSSDSTIARVDAMGRVTASALGTAVIAVSALCCGVSDSVVVEVNGETDTLTITVTSANSVVVSDLALQVGDSVDLNATASNALGQPLGTINPTWTSSSPSVASVSSDGLVKALLAGSTDIVAVYQGATATVVTTVTNPAVPPPPPPPPPGVPQPSGSIRYDTRAGGAHSIQATGVTTFAQAQSVSGFSTSTGVAFTTDADGSGSHAWRFDWPGVASTTQIDKSIGRGMSGVGITSGEIYVQWKIWQTRTSGGGGIGATGSWDSYSQGPGSGKRVVWFKPGTNDGRFTFAPGRGNDHLGQFFIENSYNPAYASVAINWDDYVSQWITLTFHLKPESSNGASDGIVEAWFNGTQIYSNMSAATRTGMWTGELQIGGPTWIGVPQDQTMYIKDVVVWQP